VNYSGRIPLFSTVYSNDSAEWVMGREKREARLAMTAGSSWQQLASGSALPVLLITLLYLA
jgi:hypothetical protein